jgi:predicted ArsR family transcriptional regulator
MRKDRQGRDVKGTRDEIVALLREGGECTVATLAGSLGIAPAAVRRHLEILAGEGTVEHRAVRQPAGRPYFAYRLTERALARETDAYPRLLERLVGEVAALDRAQLHGKDGRALLATVFDNMGEHLARDYASRVRGESLEERAASLTEALRDEGIIERWSRAEDGIHLATSACPHRRAAQAAPALCESEARLLTTLLGSEVVPIARLVDGAPVCEYVVKCDEPLAIGR